MNLNMNNNAGMLWTGGKDSCLALMKSQSRNIKVKCLVTFIPDDNSEFKAHPIRIIKKQASLIGLPLELIKTPVPYRENYVKGMVYLKDKYNLSTLVTGDIDLVDGHPNWIKQCADSAGLNSTFPLWNYDRSQLLWELIKENIEAKISWINHSEIPTAWLGRNIDETFINDISCLNKKFGIDICGENGEFHTMTMNAPIFSEYLVR